MYISVILVYDLYMNLLETLTNILMMISSFFGTASAEAPEPVRPVEPVCQVLAGTVDEDPNGIDRLIEAEGTGVFDYEHYSHLGYGAWIAESGDGRVVGYSLQEDSEISECPPAN